MEDERGPPATTEGPIMCTNKCGFYGNSATMNLCSKCYKDRVLNQIKASEFKAAVHKSFGVDSKLPETSVVRNSAGVFSGEPLASSSSSSSEDVVNEGEFVAGAEEARQVSNRCFSCRKRVGLTGFKCRCENTFCSLHRYSEKHECPFDYKTVGRRNLEKANPVVKAEKVQKI